nr:Fic/DOC family N-terminal domain-containing protein [Microlunatus antarcticus]
MLPPTGEQETRAVLKATIAARAALAALDQAARLLPNPAVLLNAATLLEAQASSEIENIVTTADELFRYAESDEVGGHATKEALRYRAALYEGVSALVRRPLTFGTATAVCSRIKDVDMTIRRMSGTRIANPATRRVVYAPPEGFDVISDKLANWERFLHDDALGLDPLVRMAIAHYQFEAIHPFHDGNGRTGRIVNILALVEEGLIAEPVLYLSRYLIRHKSEYYRLLNAVTSEEAWEDWILYVLRAVELTARSTLIKISGIRTIQDEVSERARTVTRGGRDATFLTLLFEQPYVRIKTVVERCEVSRPTATAWLSDLVGADVLSERRTGRERLFVNHRFLEVLLRDELEELDA